MNDAEFRTIFANNLNSAAEIYGEASILFDQLENVEMGEGISLFQFLDSNRNPELNSGFDSFNDMIGIQPYLRIFYISADSNDYKKWNNYENEVPKVVVVSQDYDERTQDTVTGFDNEGIPFIINADQHPNFPTLVLGFEELWVAIDKSTNLSYCDKDYDFVQDDIIFENDYYTYIIPGDDPDPDDPLGQEQVYYCDKIYPESNAYNFGSFRFGLTEDNY